MLTCFFRTIEAYLPQFIEDPLAIRKYAAIGECNKTGKFVS